MKSERKTELDKLKNITEPHKEPVAAATFYGYTRVSHVNSLTKGDSLPAQELRIKNYYDTILSPLGIVNGGIYNDGMNISAYSVPFSLRPAGKLILSKIQPGDHLVLDKVDRIWRSIEDFCTLMKLFRKRDITVHIVNFLGQSIQNNTVLGDFILRQFVMVAELESAIKSERIKEGLAHARNRRGTRAANTVPFGTSRYKYPDGHRTRAALKWNEMERKFMSEIVRLRDDEGLSWKEAGPIIARIEAEMYDREIRTPRQIELACRYTWTTMYMMETAYRYLGIEDPNKIPTIDIIREAKNQYKRVNAGRPSAAYNYKTCYATRSVIEPNVLMQIAKMQ